MKAVMLMTGDGGTMTKALEEALGVIEGRIAEIQQDNELTRLLAARAALRGQDPTAPAEDTGTTVQALENQRDALQRALDETREQRDQARAVIEKMTATSKQQAEVVETQRQAISNLRKQLSDASGKPTPVPAPQPKAKPAPKPSKAKGSPRTISGFNELEPPFPDDVLRIVQQEFGTREFTFAEAVEAVHKHFPDSNSFKVKNRLVILRDEGRALHNGKTARGSRWRASPLPEEAPSEPAAPGPASGPSATAVADVHRFVRDQREPFSGARVSEATGLPREVVIAIVEDLCDRKIATDISPSPDMRLFEYRKPTEPGAAAELDAARKPSGNGSHETAEPVAGTGRGPKVRNKELQALIDSCIKVGARVLQAGNGHFAVTFNSKRTLISSTPSNPRSVLNDRTRLRRAGVPV